MLVIKVIGLMVYIVVVSRWKRARVPLVLLLVIAALVLRGLHCGHEQTNPRNTPAPTLPARGLLGPAGDEKGCPDPNNCIPPDEGVEESVKGGTIPADGCPDPNNCIPPGPSFDAVRDPAQ